MPASPFSALGLSAPLVASLTQLGYEEPTPVQRETIPLILAGRDLLAQAATGTGKTAAFALPMVEALQGAGGGVSAMVLVPTRELAMQVSEAIHKYGRSAGICVVPLYGGASMDQQIRALRKDIGREFGVATRLLAGLLGPVLLWTSRREEKQLAEGKTYEPRTFIERRNWTTQASH